MTLDLIQFLRAANPGKTIDVSKPEQQKLYIDFASVRGGNAIEGLQENITIYYPDEPTCDLFTGHIGCGKSTELLRLKAQLEKEGFFVIYFTSSEDLEMADVDTSDVLLAIARRLSQSWEQFDLASASKFRALLQGAARALQTEINISQIEVGGSGIPKVGVSVKENQEFSLALGIGKITAKAKSDVKLREKLNQYLGPQKNQLIEAINTELVEPAIAKLKEQGKKGLVIIVDNLDRLDNQVKTWGRPQQEYLFIDQAEYLQSLHCHLVYTMPLGLKFSDEYGRLVQRYPEEPKVLPMVRVRNRDGSDHEPGLALMRQMVLVRAFPQLSAEARLEQVSTVFDTPGSLDHLCRISGGHMRDLLRLLSEWIKKDRKRGILTRPSLEEAIRSRRNELSLSIDDHEWSLLRRVQERKKVSGDQGYQKLIHSRLVFEYRDRGESWFDLNPVLFGAEELDDFAP